MDISEKRMTWYQIKPFVGATMISLLAGLASYCTLWWLMIAGMDGNHLGSYPYKAPFAVVCAVAALVATIGILVWLWRTFRYIRHKVVTVILMVVTVLALWIPMCFVGMWSMELVCGLT